MGNQRRLNLRILMWHLNITPTWKFSWTYNNFHKGLKYGWFELYEQKLFVPLSYFD